MQRQVLVLIALAACERGGGDVGGAATRGERAAALEPMPAGAVRTSGPHYTVDTAPAAACAAGAPCTVLAELTALDGYKVNKEYPFRFVLPADTGWRLEGTPTFHHAPPRMRMTVRAHRERGTTPFAGTLKLSVCDDDECLVENAELSVNIP